MGMFCRCHSMGDGMSQNPKAPRIESSSFKAKAAKELTKIRVGMKALEERFTFQIAQPDAVLLKSFFQRRSLP